MKDLNNNNVAKLVVIFLGVLIFFLAFYAITYFTTRYRRPNYEVEQAQVQTENILVGNILNRNHEEYYVLVVQREDFGFGRYRGLLDGLFEEELISKYYIVDLDEAFNNSYISEDSFLQVERASEFQFSDSSLIRVSNGRVDEYWIGSLEITKYLASK